MQIRSARRSVLLAGAIVFLGATAGARYLLAQSENDDPEYAADSIMIARSPSDRPLPLNLTAPLQSSTEASGAITPLVDEETEYRLSSAAEEDTANSRQRMVERSQHATGLPRRSPDIDAPANDQSWAP